MKKSQSGTIVGQTARKSLVPFVTYIFISALLLSPAAMRSYGRPLEKIGGLSVGSVLKGVSLFSARVIAVFQTIVLQNPWENQYKTAEAQRRELEYRLSELQNSATENKRLRELLGLSSQIQWQHVNAEIIARSGANLQDSFTIDVGSRDGVRRDAPVIGFGADRYALIGKVHTVGSNQATVVSLASLYQLGITAMLAHTRYTGILTSSGNSYQLNFINWQALNQIQIGDLVVSAGDIESLYPHDIPIGTVGSIEELEYNASLSLTVKPIVELGQIGYVAVLLDTAQVVQQAPSPPESTGLQPATQSPGRAGAPVQRSAQRSVQGSPPNNSTNSASPQPSQSASSTQAAPGNLTPTLSTPGNAPSGGSRAAAVTGSAGSGAAPPTADSPAVQGN